MGKTLDPVSLAKDIAKATGVPLAKVANVMQKYPLNGAGTLKAYEECRVLAAAELEKKLKGMFNL